MNKLFVYSIIGIMLILLFVPLPVPVENIDGAKDKDNFIYGGLYWTSVYEQAQFENYIPLGLLLIPLIFVFLKKEEDSDGVV